MKSLRLLAALFCALPSVPAAAQRIAPMIYDLTPVGEGSTQVLRLENNLTRPITIETVVYRRDIAPDGTETRTDASDDFMIFPPQAIVQPNAVQAFRVRYIGEPDRAATGMYVVSFNQVPLPADAVQGVQFVVNFGTSAYVTPAGAAADLSVTSTQATADGKNVVVIVENKGRRYASLALSQFRIATGGGQSFTLEGEPLRNALGLSVVPAGGKRIFTLPVPAGFNTAGPLTASVRYDPATRAQ